MNVYEILPKAYDVGDGELCEIFVSGCPLHCPFCFNAMLRNPQEGHAYGEKDREVIWKALANPMNSGICWVGGDPIAYFPNQEPIAEISREIRKDFPDKKIWIYTGLEWESIKSLPITAEADVIVCGPYVQEANNGKAVFRGSENQYIINVKESLRQNKRVYWLDFEGNPMGPGDYGPLDVSGEGKILNVLIKAVESNRATVAKDSSDYGKGLSAAYGNVIDYYNHLKKEVIL